MTLTAYLAAFAADTPRDAIPGPVTSCALALTTDLIGSAIRAASEADSSPSILAMVEGLGLAGGESCTVFGLNRRFGAAAAGRLLGLDAAGMETAFGVAASQASGSLQFLENGAWNKRYQVGEAAMKGVMAASLAAHGFRGATEALEGKHGFLQGYSDGARPDRVIEGLGQVWETLRIGVKPYPACRYTHAAVDGLLTLRPSRLDGRGYLRDHRRPAPQRHCAGRRTAGRQTQGALDRRGPVLDALRRCGCGPARAVWLGRL